MSFSTGPDGGSGDHHDRPSHLRPDLRATITDEPGIASFLAEAADRLDGLARGRVPGHWLDEHGVALPGFEWLDTLLERHAVAAAARARRRMRPVLIA